MPLVSTIRAPVNRGWTTSRSPVERSVTISFARRQLLRIVAPESRRANACFPVSRSTSARVTFTLTTEVPAIAASRSRAIVSVSGSSGIALQLSPRDVATKLFPVEGDPFRVIPRGPNRFFYGCARPGDGENASATGLQLACVFIACRTCMEHVDPARGSRQPDRITLSCCVRISVRGEHRRRRESRVPSQRTRNVQLISPRDLRHRLEETAPQQRQKCLGLRIPEPAVELDHPRTVAGEHQPGIEQPGERPPF